LSAIISDLPISLQTAKLLVSLLLRIDKKLMNGGVDDSDGAVGGFIEQTVQILQEYSKIDPECRMASRSYKEERHVSAGRNLC